MVQENVDIQGNITKETGCSVGIILEALFNVLKDEYVIGETNE